MLSLKTLFKSKGFRYNTHCPEKFLLLTLQMLIDFHNFFHGQT